MLEKNISIIIPCFNESKNLEKLVNRIKIDLKKVDYFVEVILVNNGSTDDSQMKIEELLKQSRSIKVVNLVNNIGYGNGILAGLSHAKNNFLGWTHADLQCDFIDCLNGFDILYKNIQNTGDNYLLKGKRLNRSFLDYFFTKLMSIFVKFFCKVDLDDINAQPKIFSRKLYNLFENPPKDFLLDFYLMNLSKKYNYKLLNLDVNFSKRLHGKPKGGGSLIGKIKLSIKTAYYILKYQNGNNYSQNK